MYILNTGKKQICLKNDKKKSIPFRFSWQIHNTQLFLYNFIQWHLNPIKKLFFYKKKYSIIGFKVEII